MSTRGVVLGQNPGRAKLEKARELRRNMTAAERLLWARLRANRLGGFHFRRQHIIYGFIVDFYCHTAALVVEVDGEVHAGAPQYDAERNRILTAHGLRVIRFTNDQVTMQTEKVLTTIGAACKSQESAPGVA